MTCFTTIILGLFSRIAIVIWWLVNSASRNLPFKTWVLPGGIGLPAWLWTAIGFIFLPWTTLAYLLLFPGGILGYEWILLLIAFLVDLGCHGGTYYHRDRFSFLRR